MTGLTAHPLTPDRWENLVTVFGGGEGKGDCGRCWCMCWRLPRPSIVEGLGKKNKALFKKRVKAGPPPRLVGYDEADEPICNGGQSVHESNARAFYGLVQIRLDEAYTDHCIRNAD